MLRNFPSCLVLIIVLTVPALCWGYDLTGRWEATVLGAPVAAEFSQTGQKFTGVMRIPEPGGKINVYHLVGIITEAKFMALHGSGHVLEGEMLSEDEARGEFKIAGGPTLPVRLHRLGRTAK